MKYLLFITLFFTVLFNSLYACTLVTDDDLRFLRITYYSAVENEDDVETLGNYIVKKFGADKKNYPPIILAYVGGIEALKSKHSFWITSKYNHLVKSMEIFEKAVEKDPNNLEIRFMRFSILHYVPSIVGYGSEKKSDLTTVYNLLTNKQIKNIPADILTGMAQFLIDSNRLEPYQIEELKKVKTELARL